MGRTIRALQEGKTNIIGQQFVQWGLLGWSERPSVEVYSGEHSEVDLCVRLCSQIRSWWGLESVAGTHTGRGTGPLVTPEVQMVPTQQEGTGRWPTPCRDFRKCLNIPEMCLSKATDIEARCCLRRWRTLVTHLLLKVNHFRQPPKKTHTHTRQMKKRWEAIGLLP